MKQETPDSRPYGDETRRRPGWGAILGFFLALAGLALLVMVLLAVVLGSSWLPVYGAAGEPPTLISRLEPALATAPTRAAVVLPTPLPDELFSSAAGIPQSGFGTALLPQSPAGFGHSAAEKPAGPIDGSARLEIPAIGVNAPIQAVGLVELEQDGRRYQQWRVPNAYAVGWHATSARPGRPGNTVLNGHNNVYGAVFRDLVALQLGDEMTIYEDGQAYHYQVAHRELVEEKDQPLDVRLNNARWMLPTSDERLTLISCWPAIGITHRVIVVATAVDGG
ncbi:MAG: sortase [Chloroflexota bacterium]|jgi:LPXTG-site transpeptidase (sortase) family protein